MGPAVTPAASEPAPVQSKRSGDADASVWREDEGRPSAAPRPVRPSTPLPVPIKTEPVPRRARLVSWRLVTVLTILLLLAVIVADGAWAAFRLNKDLETVAEQLGKIGGGLADGRLDEAQAEARKALGASRSAIEAGRRPSLALVSLVPGADEEIRTVVDMAAASEDAARAGEAVIRAARALGLDADGVPEELYSGGRVQLDTATSARDELNLAERSLTEAQITLERLSPRLQILQEPLDAARGRVGDALTRATNARTLFDLLHPLLGGRGERDYLLAFQAPGEARGTGGLVGVAGVLSASGGSVELGRIRPYPDIVKGKVGPVESPDWFRQSYEPHGALTEWPQANISPNYPVVSQVYLEMYQQATGKALDGVFAMDPIALSQLMRGMEPIRTSNPDLTVDAGNVAETLLVESYTRFEDPDQQNEFLGQVVELFWDRVSGGDFDLKTFADSLGEAVRTQHVKIYSNSVGEQGNIQVLDLDGNYASRGPGQMAFNVNYAANKVDYYLHRDLATEVDLQADGSARVSTTMTLHNQAPAGPASALLGQQPDLAPGVNRTMVNLLMPPGSLVDSFSLNGEEQEPFTYVDETSPVIWDVIAIPPGDRQTVEVGYSIPNALLLFEEGTVFNFTLFPQATVNPDSFSLTVQPPPGYGIVGAPGDISADGSIEMAGKLDRPVPVSVQLQQE